MEVEMYLDLIGDQVWHKKGSKKYWHREDGPARIYNNILGSSESWWYHGIRYETPKSMPLNLFLAYVKWELKKNV